MADVANRVLPVHSTQEVVGRVREAAGRYRLVHNFWCAVFL